jgi:hypothetical protein
MRWPWQRPYDSPDADDGPRFVLLPSGALRDVEHARIEASRQHEREKSLAAQQAARDADRAAEVERQRQIEQHRREQSWKELPPHLRGGSQ